MAHPPADSPQKVSAFVSEAPNSPDEIRDCCDACGETRQIARIKGCLKCLTCGYKADCHGF
jgi:hypothetical protein